MNVNMDDNTKRFLSKTLAYMLRHNQKLTLHKGGFILLDDLKALPQLKRFSEAQILEVINNSTSNIDSVTKRFESTSHGGKTFVRASYGHSISIEEATTVEERELFEEAMQKHNRNGKGISRLVDLCVDSVVANIKQYDSLGGLCDTYLVGLLFASLKANKKLSNPVLKLFFSPNIDTLDLTNLLLTDSSVQRMTTACPSLTSLNLKGQFAVVTNNALSLIAKRLTKLRFLGLGECKYITDPVISNLKSLTALESLDLSACFSLTDEGIKALAVAAPQLRQLKLARLTKLSDASVAALRPLQLQLLDLGYVTALTDNSIEYLRCCRGLRSLGLCGLFQISGSAVLSLVDACPELVSLNLQHCPKVSPDDLRKLTEHTRKLKLSLGLPTAAKPREGDKKSNTEEEAPDS